MKLPQELQTSYLHRKSYPANLVPSGTFTYKTKLASYVTRLNEAERDFCLVDSEDAIDDIFEIPIIDIGTADGKALVPKNIHSAAKLSEWLGVDILSDASDPTVKQVITRKKDPKCRFICIYAENSRDKLKLTRESLCQIMSYHQIMPVYLDFMLVFGSKSDAKDLRFSGFRDQIQLKPPTSGHHEIPELGRSGKIFQLCYNLKSVHLEKRGSEKPEPTDWSIRDAAFYHQFDVEYGTTLWIVTKGGLDILDRYQELVGPSVRPGQGAYDDLASCFRSTLATHLLYCQWSTEDWRWYIVWLEEIVDEESSMAVDGPRGYGYAHQNYEPRDLQDLQHWQDKTNEVVMVLEANAKVLRSLRKFYSDLIARKDFPLPLRNACEDELIAFFSQLDSIIDDFEMQIARARLLANIISDRKELVLQHLQSQASERTEQLNRNLEREAVVMRIITIVTLIYLPATFVSTFFSTDVIKYQDQDQSPSQSSDFQNQSFSSLALKRWLQVTIPLTALTLLGAWSTYRLYTASAQGVTLATRLRRSFISSRNSFHIRKSPQDGSYVFGATNSGKLRRVENVVSIALSRLSPRNARWQQTNGSVLPSHNVSRAVAG
ncbi:unnamed protein product [Alternaria alternata]|uniref:CorA-like transporter domain-containing protein n=1 Tax=Alternaria tenuissima TaxID=119927 RepID=A0AB37WBQ0_9PLEO|nr:hypothetical protein AA0115_g7696 [Alternaria tenuissima]